MEKKQKLGQFYTKNSSYILRQLVSVIPENATIIDPFAGDGDILKFVKKRKPQVTIESYDIDPQYENCNKQDSLMNPPEYKGKWVVTNPPYLAKNKSNDKEIFDKYQTNDLYKASLKSISGFNTVGCEGGLIVVPLNFFSDRDDKMRRYFFNRYNIVRLNIFEESVFSDTSYTVCSFSFRRKDDNFIVGDDRQRCKNVWIYPEKVNRDFTFSHSNGYKIGNGFNKLLTRKSHIKVGRLVHKELTPRWFITNLFLRAVDTGTSSGRISLRLSEHPFYAEESDRTFATIISNIELSHETQETVVEMFNELLETYRERYHSLFLTNFRNSTSEYARKRIEFKAAYGLIEYCINSILRA